MNSKNTRKNLFRKIRANNFNPVLTFVIALVFVTGLFLTKTNIVSGATSSGYTDHVDATNCIISGWAKDNDYAGAISVDVYQGGEIGSGGILVGRTTANLSRGDNLPGYSFRLPDGFNGTFYAYAVDVDTSGTPNGQNVLLPIYTANVPSRQLACTNGIAVDESANQVDLLSNLGFYANLGDVVPVLHRGDYGIYGASPDTAMSTEIIDGVTKTFFTCLGNTTQLSCLSENSSIDNFNNASGLYKTSDGTKFQTVLGGPIPGDPYESQYAGIASTWKDPATGYIHAWYHSEIPVPGCSSSFYASIGYAISTDGGYSFVKQGRAITSPDTIVSGLCVGQGSSEAKVIESGNYLYMIYDQGTNDWSNMALRGGVSIARALKTEPNNWFKYYNGSFSEPGVGGKSSPIIYSGQNGMQTWAGFSIWSSYLSKFVMLHTDYNNPGAVYIRTSTDLINWSNPYLLFSSASYDYRYATIIGTTDDIIGQSGWIYFGRHPKGSSVGPDTLLARRSISFNTATPDTTAPVVSVITPAVGELVTGVVNITANASDDVAVSKVEFYLDGALIGTSSTGPSPYGINWDTNSLVEGSVHTIYAKAYDSAGNTATSSTVSVTIKDKTSPVVSITFPANNSTVNKKSKVTITASATDSIGVTKVEFYVNNSLVCTDTTSSYSCTWTVPANPSSYNLTAKAYDVAGNVGTSAIVKTTSK